MDELERRLRAKIPGRRHRDRGAQVDLRDLRPDQTQCGLDLYVRDGRIIKVEGLAGEPAQRRHPVLQGRGHPAVRLPRGPAAHAAQAGGAARLRRVRPHLLGRGARHRRRQPAAARRRERARIGRVLRGLSQAAAPVRAAAGPAVRLAQLLHRVEHLLHGDGDGLQAGLRPAGHARPAQRPVPAGVERQPVLLQHHHGPPPVRRASTAA